MAAVALGIGACTTWFLATVTAPVDEANEFLADIDAGDYIAAAEHIAPLCSNGLDANRLAALFNGADIDYNLNSSSVQNGSDAQVSGSFSSDDGDGARSIELSLIKSGEQWRVCSFQRR